MIYLSAIGCFIILLFSWIKLRDVIAPPFILSSIWLLMYILLMFRSEVDLGSSMYYLVFFVGLCFFVMGFFLVIQNKNKKNFCILKERKSNLAFNKLFINIILLIGIILFMSVLIDATTYIQENFVYNFWQTLRIGKSEGTYNEGDIISYSRNPIIALSIVCSTLYYSNPTSKNRKRFLISIVIALLLVITSGNRGMIFLLVLAVFFNYLIVKNCSNKRSMLYLLLAISIILSIFIATAFLKYVYDDQNDILEFIMKNMRIYFSTSMIAFVEWIEKFDEYLYGANTLRFFYVILNTIGYNDIKISPLIQDFIWVHGDQTNVYTIIQYYAADFGIMYAFIIQIVLGIFYGFLYNKAIMSGKINVFYISLQSILYFPLINQFFDDKYFSILSTWIQLIFWLYFFTRKKFLN